MDAPRKLSYQELLDSMSPFLDFPETEDVMRGEKQRRIAQATATTNLTSDAKGSAEDLSRFLSSARNANEFKDRLKMVLAITQGSLEALDRVCMVICPLQKTWAQRQKSEEATVALAEFLVDPTSNTDIPWFTAERFRLPDGWPRLIRSGIAAQIHGSLQSLYNTRLGLALESKIGRVVENAGYTWEKGFVHIVDQKEVDVVVPQLALPRILIMASYNLTTASSQSQRAREQMAMHKQVRDYNALRSNVNEPDVQLINVVDGAGWLARLNDLRQMHQHCDYVLSFAQLSLLPNILRYHMRK